MKIKTITRVAAALAITGMFASCSTSNQVASSFGSRKYTKGYFLNNPGKQGPVAPNATAYASTATSTAVEPTVLPAEKSISIAPVTTVNSASLSTSPVLTQKAEMRKLAATNVTAKVATKAASAAQKSTFLSKFMFTMDSPDSISSTEKGGGSCKSWIVCFILCALLGEIGVHRFYMGYIWQGVVQLLTLGGCGIWTLIDWIRIITKSLKPKGGDYC